MSTRSSVNEGHKLPSHTVKLPVIEVVVQTLGYLFGHFVQVLRIALPVYAVAFLPLIALVYFMGTQIIDDIMVLTAEGEIFEYENISTQIALYTFMSMISQLLFFGMMGAAFSRHIVLGVQSPFIPLDRHALRFVGASIMTGILLFILIALVTLCFVFVVVGLLEMGDEQGTSLLFLPILALSFLIFYFSMRVLLIPTHAAVNERIKLIQGFRVTRGNAFRLLGAMLLIWIAVIVIAGIMFATIAAIGLTMLPALDAARDVGAILQILIEFAVSPAGITVLILYFLTQLLITSATFIMFAQAYKFLAGYEAAPGPMILD